jgi:hypothetical protein
MLPNPDGSCGHSNRLSPGIYLFGGSCKKPQFVLLASAFRQYRFQRREWEEWAEAADKRALVVPAEQRGGRWRMGQVTSDVVNLREPLLRLETYTCERMTAQPPEP